MGIENHRPPPLEKEIFIACESAARLNWAKLLHKIYFPPFVCALGTIVAWAGPFSADDDHSLALRVNFSSNIDKGGIAV